MVTVRRHDWVRVATERAYRIDGGAPVGSRSRLISRGDGGTIWAWKQGVVAPGLIIALACFFGLGGNARCESTARTNATAQRNDISTGRIVKKRSPARKAERRAGAIKTKNLGDSAVRQERSLVVNRKVTGAKAMVSVRRQDSGPTSAAGEFAVMDAEACQHQLRDAIQPVKLIRLAEECERLLPEGAIVEEIRRIASGARSAMEAQRLAGMTTELFEDSVGDGTMRELIARAVRGDMDAAYGIAQAYRSGKMGIERNPRRMEQWLLFSAELGKGRASWELAEHYNYGGLVSDAARFERKALDLGFRPPLRLPSRGY